MFVDGQRKQWRGGKKEEVHVSGAMIHRECWEDSNREPQQDGDGEGFTGKICLRDELGRLSRQHVPGSAEKGSVFKGCQAVKEP